MKTNFSRVVIVNSKHGEKYIGEVPGTENAHQVLARAAEGQLPFALVNARLLISQMRMNQAGDGQVHSVANMILLVPIDMCPGPLEKIHVVPSSWYFPINTPSIQKKVEELIKGAEDNEKVNSAMEAGIHVPGSVGNRPQ